MKSAASAYYELYKPSRSTCSVSTGGQGYLWQLPQHAWAPLGFLLLSGPSAAQFIGLREGEWLSVHQQGLVGDQQSLNPDDKQRGEKERRRQAMDLASHLRAACTNGKRLDACKTSFFSSPGPWNGCSNAEGGREISQESSTLEQEASYVCLCVWVNLSDCLRGSASRDRPVSFSISSAEAFVLQHLLPLSFPLQSISLLLKEPPPVLTPLALAVIKRPYQYQGGEAQLKAVQGMQLSAAAKLASEGRHGGLLASASREWQALRASILNATDLEEWRHFLAFAAALLEASLPGGLMQQAHDPAFEGSHGLYELHQRQEREKIHSRLWLEAVEAAIMRGPCICGGWGCLLHCALAPQAATVARHFDFAAARGWGVKVDPAVDGKGSAAFSQLLHRACASQGLQGRPVQPQAGPSVDALSTAASLRALHSSEVASPEDTPQQHTPKSHQPQQQKGLSSPCAAPCPCRLCALSSLQLHRVLCLLDPLSLAAFSCTSKAHWVAAQVVVSGLEAVGSSWIHSPGVRPFWEESDGEEGGLQRIPGNLPAAARRGAVAGGRGRRSATGGLFRHQVHALLWLRHRERQNAPQQPPADLHQSWRLLGNRLAAQKVAEEGSRAEKVVRRLKSDLLSPSAPSGGGIGRDGELDSETAWPWPRRNDCRPADDLLKNMCTWIELPLPRSSWLSEARSRRAAQKENLTALQADKSSPAAQPPTTAFRVEESQGLRLLQGQGKCLRVFSSSHPKDLVLLGDRCGAAEACTTSAASSAEGGPAILLPHLLETAQSRGDFSLYVASDLKVALLGYSGGSFESSYDQDVEGRRRQPDAACVGGMFCDDPGLGKTLSLLSLAVLCKSRKHMPPRHVWPPPASIPSSTSQAAAEHATEEVLQAPLMRKTRTRTRQARMLGGASRTAGNPSLVHNLWRIPSSTVREHFQGADVPIRGNGNMEIREDRFSGVETFFCYNDPTFPPQEPLLPIEGSQRLAEDLCRGRVLSEWQLKGGEEKTAALRSKLQRIYRDLHIVGVLIPSPCGRALRSQISDAVRQVEQQTAQAKKLLSARDAENTLALEPNPSVQTPGGALQVKMEERPCEGNQEDSALASTDPPPPKRQCRSPAACVTEAKAGVEAPTPPSSTSVPGSSPDQATLSHVPLLRGRILRSPPQYLCSNTTLVICPPFLARHWEAQLEQWFGWHHLPPSERVKVLVFERPAELASVSRFDIAASDIVVVTTNVLTKEFSRCLANPLETPEQQKQQPRRRSECLASGAAAEERFWDQLMLRDEESEGIDSEEMTLLQRLASVMPRDQQQKLASVLKRRSRQPQSSLFTSPGSAAGARGISSIQCAKSPLLGVHFERIAVDEGHRLAQSGSLHVQLACTLRANKRSTGSAHAQLWEEERVGVKGCCADAIALKSTSTNPLSSALVSATLCTDVWLDSLFHSNNRSSASTVLWNLRFSCTLRCQAHLFVQRKWVDETLQMLAEKHPKYTNPFPYKYDFSRLVYVTAVFLRVSSVERHTVRCDMCCQKIRFPLLVPCRMLHLLCSSCLFPNFLADLFCSRPAVTGCPLCWPWCPVNGDFMDRLQPPVEHTTHFDWPYAASKGRAQQARALARTAASFAADDHAAVTPAASAAPPTSLQVELRSPCVWPSPPQLPLRARTAAADAAAARLLSDFHAASCSPSLWLSADLLNEAEEMVARWHERPQRKSHPHLASFSRSPVNSAAAADTAAARWTQAPGVRENAATSPSPREPAAVVSEAPPIRENPNPQRLSTTAVVEASSSPAAAIRLSSACSSADPLASDGAEKCVSSTSPCQFFFLHGSRNASPTKQQQRRLMKGDDGAPIDFVDVEDVESFVGNGVREPSRAAHASSNVSPSSCSMAHSLRGPRTSALSGFLDSTTTSTAHVDKLASLDVDQEDQSFLRSSKYAAVARRILALIESRQFGQNNIPWDALADTDSNPSPSVGTVHTRGGGALPGEPASAPACPPTASALKVKSMKDIPKRCEKIIVAASFWESLFLLGQFLERHDVRCGYFTERTERKLALSALRSFVEDDMTQVLLLSTSVGAHGLDLSCASHVLILDPPTDPNLEQQARLLPALLSIVPMPLLLWVEAYRIDTAASVMPASNCIS
ncbi:swi2 snf2-containing protein [Cyclospora cayetanensis]|uniref:Swi2 snf2-containing protein n=1 Tax=Cyclospora cayetanensis TaxID=88456 RepID=A0A1D3D1W1_9EIME|nr:swi2 snf2-containing protein [Cyclospora cayetanensis]